MDLLFNPMVIRVLGLLLLGALLTWAALGVAGQFSRLQYQRRLQERRVAHWDARVAAALAQRKRYEKEGFAWNGFRKFEVARKIQETEEICSFYLVPHDHKPLPPFLPGQYLTFRFQIPGRDKSVIRCYSLSDSPLQSDYYRISVKKEPPPPHAPEVPAGLVSSYLHEQVNEGDILDVRAPDGRFRLGPEDQKAVVLIGGGVGVTPMLSIFNTLTGSNDQRDIYFFYGARNGDYAFMRTALETRIQVNKNAQLVWVYSEPQEHEVQGKDYHESGFMDLALFKKYLPSNNFIFFICGPPPMIKGVSQTLKDWGVPQVDIRFETFSAQHVQAVAGLGKTQAFEVTFAKSGKKSAWQGKGSLLDLAETAGVNIESGCRAGNCGSCLVAVRSGNVEYLHAPGFQPEEGSCLTCIAQPAEDLVLDI